MGAFGNGSAGDDGVVVKCMRNCSGNGRGGDGGSLYLAQMVVVVVTMGCKLSQLMEVMALVVVMVVEVMMVVCTYHR